MTSPRRRTGLGLNSDEGLDKFRVPTDSSNDRTNQSVQDRSRAPLADNTAPKAKEPSKDVALLLQIRMLADARNHKQLRLKMNRLQQALARLNRDFAPTTA